MQGRFLHPLLARGRGFACQPPSRLEGRSFCSTERLRAFSIKARHSTLFSAGRGLCGSRLAAWLRQRASLRRSAPLCLPPAPSTSFYRLPETPRPTISARSKPGVPVYSCALPAAAARLAPPRRAPPRLPLRPRHSERGRTALADRVLWLGAQLYLLSPEGDKAGEE